MGHTPGPWKVSKTKRLKQEADRWREIDMLSPVNSHRHYAAIVVFGTFSDASEGLLDANARLVAAAPDLLAACKSALGWYGLDGDGISDPTLTQLRAAIEKAEAK